MFTYTGSVDFSCVTYTFKIYYSSIHLTTIPSFLSVSSSTYTVYPTFTFLNFGEYRIQITVTLPNGSTATSSQWHYIDTTGLTISCPKFIFSTSSVPPPPPPIPTPSPPPPPPSPTPPPTTNYPPVFLSTLPSQIEVVQNQFKIYQLPQINDAESNTVNSSFSPVQNSIASFFNYFSGNRTLIMAPTDKCPKGSYTFQIRLDDYISAGNSYQIIIEVIDPQNSLSQYFIQEKDPVVKTNINKTMAIK